MRPGTGHGGHRWRPLAWGTMGTVGTGPGDGSGGGKIPPYIARARDRVFYGQAVGRQNSRNSGKIHCMGDMKNVRWAWAPSPVPESLTYGQVTGNAKMQTALIMGNILLWGMALGTGLAVIANNHGGAHVRLVQIMDSGDAYILDHDLTMADCIKYLSPARPDFTCEIQ